VRRFLHKSLFILSEDRRSMGRNKCCRYWRTIQHGTW